MENMISIPVGYVCIETDAYEAIVHDATKAEDIDAKVEAAFNRGYAEGKAAAYEEYIAGCLRDKDKAVGHDSPAEKAEAPQETPESATDGDTKSPAPEVKGIDELLDSLNSVAKARHSGRPKKGEGGLDDKELMKLRARGYKMTQLVSALGYSETTIRNHLKAIEAQHPEAARDYVRR